MEKFYNVNFKFFDVFYNGDSYNLTFANCKNLILSEEINLNFKTQEELLNSRELEFILSKKDEKNSVFVSFDGNSILDELGVKYLKLKSLLLPFKNVNISKKDFKTLFAEYKNKLILEKNLDLLFFLFSAYFYSKNKEFSRNFISYLDLTAISTVADMMTIRNENLGIVSIGISQINKRTRDSIKFLLARREYAERELVSKDISFFIAPCINSAYRLKKTSVSFSFFSDDNPEHLDLLSRELIDINQDRKSLVLSIVEKYQDKIMATSIESDGQISYLIFDDVDHGFTGLIANNIKERFGTDFSLVLSTKGDAVTGSLRCTEPCAIEILEKLDEYLNSFGGHHNAAGFSLKDKGLVKAFLNSLLRILKDRKRVEKNDIDEIDLEINSGKFPISIIDYIKVLEPFGYDNPEPNFLIRGVDGASFNIFKGKEFPLIKGKVFCENGESIPCTFFKFKGDFYKLREKKSLDFIANIACNTFRGQTEYYFLIKKFL